MVDLFIGVKSDLRGIELAALRSGNLERVLAGPVDKYITAFLVQQFVSEGSAGGAPWAPLSPETIANRKKPGRGRGGIGRDTNQMWSSLVKSPSTEGYTRISANTYERGSTVKHMWYFAGGTKRQPARPVWPQVMPDSVVERIGKAITDYVESGANV